jgi:type IV pilus assembly protein PilB
MKNKKKLGELLSERGQVTKKDLSQALDEHQRKLVLLGEVLLQRGFVERPDLVAALQEVTNVPYVYCRSVQVDPEVLKLVPRAIAVRYCVLPLRLEQQSLVLAMAQPQNMQILTELTFLAGRRISPLLGFRNEILAGIDSNYDGWAETLSQTPAVPNAVGIAQSMNAGGSGGDLGNRDATGQLPAELQAQNSPAARFVSDIIAIAAAKDASDIHLEPVGDGMTVRLRIGGALRELAPVPEELRNSVVSRLKILGEMNIAERRKPQVGRGMTQVGARRLELRISVSPTHRGETVVIRLFDPRTIEILLPDLGVTPDACETLSRLLNRSQGMILVTGPAGSGKTTTVCAALSQLCSPGVNIATVEGPVEYLIGGANQVQVNSKTGMSFASTLRSILQHDPNVLMVGDLPDGETAEIALKAAQNGHIVLTTMNSNDSVAAIGRLIELEMPGRLIADSVAAVVCQRLVRKLCTCRKQIPATDEYREQLSAAGISSPGNLMSIPVGCADCDQEGFRGRICVFEILMVDNKLRAAIRAGAPLDELRTLAHGIGMKSMQADALEKVVNGLTTLDEVWRVVPTDETAGDQCEECSRPITENFLYCPYCGSRIVSRDIGTPVLSAKGDA